VRKESDDERQLRKAFNTSYSVFIISVILIAIIPLNVHIAERITLSSVIGAFISAVIYYIFLPDLFSPFGLKKVSLIFMGLTGLLVLNGIFAGIIELHLATMVVLTFSLVYTDRLCLVKYEATESPDASLRHKLEFSISGVDLPQFFGLSATLGIYLILRALQTLQGDELDLFVSGAFVFQIVALNLVFALLQYPSMTRRILRFPKEPSRTEAKAKEARESMRGSLDEKGTTTEMDKRKQESG